MDKQKEHFRSFDDSRLIEIVKNAKQFGYDEMTRDAALAILKERGISEEDLQLTGNLTNYKYDYARTLYNSYIKNSRVAFIAYCLLLILKTAQIFRLTNINPSNSFFLLFLLTVFLLYMASLTRSFVDHINFYKAIGKELGIGDQFIFFIVGMPFYIYMFFFYRRQMKEAMLMV